MVELAVFEADGVRLVTVVNYGQRKETRVGLAKEMTMKTQRYLVHHCLEKGFRLEFKYILN